MNKPSNYFGGILMMLVGVLFLMVNTLLTLLMPIGDSFTELMASEAFLHRLSVATLLMFLLTIGTYYLYIFNENRKQTVDRICFGIAFLGCFALFAHEWAQVFYIYPLANAAPQSLEALENVEGFSLYDFEAAIAAGLYSVGWLAFATLLFIRNTYGRLAPGLVMFGFLAIILLTILLPQPYGGVLGSIPLGIGYFLLGRELYILEEVRQH